MLIPERPDDAVGESQTFGSVARFRHINAVVEVLYAGVQLKRENLHAGFEIHR